MIQFIVSLLLSLPAMAQNCPGDDNEPAVSVKTQAGPTLILCGFEDREVKSPKGKRAFSAFTVYAFIAEGKAPEKVFTGDDTETYWARANPMKGIDLEELWFFSEDKPTAGFGRTITCTTELCTLSEPKCLFKKPNPFPKALVQFRKQAEAHKLDDDGEELVDQIFAHALSGNKEAKEFYATAPTNFPKDVAEAWAANKKKLETGCKR